MTAQAVSAPATFAFQVTMPTGRSIVDTTAGAGGSVLIGSRDSILGPTASGGGTVEVQPQGATSDITTSGAVKLDDGSTVNGNILAGGTITASSSAVVHGTQTGHNSGVAPFTTSWSVTNPGNSQGAITLQNAAFAAPAPGVFDAVVVNAGSSLYLRSGTYFFQSLDLEPGANLFVDGREGPVFLYLTSSIIFRGSEKATDGGTPRLFVGYFGTSQAILEAAFQGVFLAPNATLHFQNGHSTVNAGTFYGQSLIVEPDEILKPGTFDWTTVPGMPPPPGGFANNGGPNGTCAPGSGCTGGGTGTGGAPTTIVNVPRSAINFHVACSGNPVVCIYDPDSTNPVTGPGGSPTPTTQTSVTPTPFHVLGSFEVGGVLANGTISINYTSSTGSNVTCTYKGGSSSALPTAPLDIEAGRTATLVGCSDGQPASAQRFGTRFSVAVNPAPGFAVTVDLPLDDRGCDGGFNILTPYQTRLMHDTFSWPDPTLPAAPTIAETNPDGIPALYYAWVYLHNTHDQLLLRQLYVHILSRPLFTQEFEAHAGQCGTFRNPGDGVGAFVPVLMPGKVYNALLNVQNNAFRAQNNLQGNPVPFEAVILRNGDVPAGARNANGSINFAVLKRSGFRYLNYEGSPLPSQSAMQLAFGGVSTLTQDIATFLLGEASQLGQLITSGFGDLDALFGSRVNFKITLNAANLNSGFGTSLPMVRAWGPLQGAPLGAAGLEVTLMENLLDFLPETFISSTDDSGFVSIQPAKNDASNVRGSGICVQFNNDAVWVTDFLMPDTLCQLSGFDLNAVPVGSPGVPVGSFAIKDFNEDQTIDLAVSNGYLNITYQMTDAFKFVNDVMNYKTKTAHVLSNDMASYLGDVTDDTAFTDCFHLRNESELSIEGSVSAFVDTLVPPAGSTPNPGLTDFITSVATNFANTDIIMPPNAASGKHGGGREVGSHEFGHFTFCNLLLDVSPAAVDRLADEAVLNFAATHKFRDYSVPTRYINEAFADFISGQVTSDANYQWLDTSEGDFGRVCIDAPCFDENFAGTPTSSMDNTGIARIASLIHDAFDGHGQRGRDVPNDADAWSQPPPPPPPGVSFVFSPAAYGNFDGPNTAPGTVPACRVHSGPGNPDSCAASESVALDGSALASFGHEVASRTPGGKFFLEDQIIYHALDQTMINAGYNWCQRCAVMALHTQYNANHNDSVKPIDLLTQCLAGGDTFLVSNGLPSGAPPEPNLRLDASTCQPCPSGQVPDDNGVCQVCNGAVAGRTCKTCDSGLICGVTSYSREPSTERLAGLFDHLGSWPPAAVHVDLLHGLVRGGLRALR